MPKLYLGTTKDIDLLRMKVKRGICNVKLGGMLELEVTVIFAFPVFSNATAMEWMTKLQPSIFVAMKWKCPVTTCFIHIAAVTYSMDNNEQIVITNEF